MYLFSFHACIVCGVCMCVYVCVCVCVCVCMCVCVCTQTQGKRRTPEMSSHKQDKTKLRKIQGDSQASDSVEGNSQGSKDMNTFKK